MAELPILDLERDPPKMRSAWAGRVIGLAIGAAVGLLLESASAIDGASWFPVLIISIAIHESGHLVAGKLAGMKPGGIVICGLIIFRSGPQWRCRFDYRRLLSGGMAQPLPKKGEFEPRRYAWMVAGGPIATVLLAVCAGIAWRFSGEPAGWASSFLWINLIGVANLIPFSYGANKSDGARILMLLRRPEESRRWMALLQVMAQDSEGVLPRDWDAELFAETMRYDPETGDGAYRELLAFYRRADEGNDEGALGHLEKSLAASGKCGRLIRHACFTEAACSSAVLRGNATAARTWLERAMKLGRPLTRHNLDAAIAQSEGRWEDAAKSWEAALAFLAKRKLESGVARASRRRMTECREKCLRAMGQQAQAASV